ncbi:MAG: heavy-metal-associated domain-containing protein [Clostridiaceae bacterium]|jgi:copper chaperone|nr:heavy-metal-associated domain-containing protein [Clostridiaceae bacterium]
MSEAQTSLTVENMGPDSVEKIKKALERINGVERVIVSLDNKKVFIEYDDEKINAQLIRETIEDEGYIVK